MLQVIEHCRVCGEDAECNEPGGYEYNTETKQMVVKLGDPLCQECYDENISCCGDWINSENGLCPSCKEHCK